MRKASGITSRAGIQDLVSRRAPGVNRGTTVDCEIVYAVERVKQDLVGIKKPFDTRKEDTLIALET